MSKFLGDQPMHGGKPLVVGESGTRRIFIGTGVPSNDLGEDGDIYFPDSPAGVTNPLGFAFGGEVVYTMGGVTLLFSRADYPGLRAIKLRLQAAGGGGGTAPASPTGQSAVASGGGGGGACFSNFILAQDLPADVPVDVGMGGSPGSDGGPSSFGSMLSVAGGIGGVAIGPTATTGFGAQRAIGGLASAGLLRYSGGDSHAGISLGSGVSQNFGGNGGNSLYGVGGAGGRSSSTAARNGRGYGGGGGGASTSSGVTQQAGGNGADGLVVVELYY